jgi:peptide deformylase
MTNQSNSAQPVAADPVLQFDNPALRQLSAAIAESDFDSAQLHDWINRLNRARQEFGGIGIAAPQIGLFYRLIVIEIPAYERPGFGQVQAVPMHALINPEIVWYSDDTIKAAEGCLSVLGYEGFVVRPSSVRVVAYTPQGHRLEFEAASLYARCLQHEIDHLEGILYTDHIKELRDIRKVQSVAADDPVLAHNRLIARSQAITL